MPTKKSEKTLVIVESPSKAKTIEKYLGGEYTVRASVGHIRDLPKSNKKAIDIEGGFIPHYVISPGKEEVVAQLRSIAEKSKTVILATDPDREGEAIAWHLVSVLGLKNAKRIVFHEITESAIKEALAHPRAIDEHLREAQEARRVLDRLVGYDLSGLIWKKVRYGLSAGRVQSPALRILMEREREIRAFIPERFWKIHALLNTTKGDTIELLADEEPRDETRKDEILSKGNAGSWAISSVEETEVRRSPRPPFTTSTLQQTASTRLGMSPSYTMRTAQKLYEAGLITYMRTDSVALGKDAQAAICSVIKKQFGEELVSPRTFKTTSKNAQEAHEAIRPTNPSKERAGFSEEQKKLYRLIWQRTVASQMKEALTMRTKISAQIKGEEKTLPLFSANGSRLLSPGWLLADPEAQGEDVILPKVEQGERLKLKSLSAEEKTTEPPGRYTEAGLVKELEKRGIGRPSTYASIIKTIQDRGYVNREGKTLLPTDTGDVVSTFLEKYFPDYIGDTFTAEMEDKLDEIARGERTYEKTLKEFYNPFHKEVASKEDIEKITTLAEADEKFTCPTCGGSMVVKLGKNGKFLSCKRFPECNGARTIEGEPILGPRPTGESCPECSGELVERTGRFGKFISCGNYPKCKYIKKDPELEKANSTGVQCPVCKKGDMTMRRGRFGVFYSCSNYPDCKNAIKAKPTGNICPMCQSLMMEGTKTIPERCSNKACPNHNPHKLAK